MVYLVGIHQRQNSGGGDILTDGESGLFGQGCHRQLIAQLLQPRPAQVTIGQRARKPTVLPQHQKDAACGLIHALQGIVQRTVGLHAQGPEIVAVHPIFLAGTPT